MPLLLVLSLALPALGCHSESERRLTQSVRRELEHGRGAADAWLSDAHSGALDHEADVVALGYLERLRLGLGSPFRLTAFALHDPRLPDTIRTQVAWSILERVHRGAAYEIDATALDAAGTLGIPQRAGLGETHLRIARNVIDKASDPRAGELAIRLAYTIAHAEALVSEQAPKLAGHVAALLVDRELAQRDAEALLAAASARQAHAFDLLTEWREDRRFEVEQPRVGPLPWQLEVEATELAAEALTDLRELALRATAGRLAPAEDAESGNAVAAPVWAKLARAEAKLGGPPQTAVIVPARQLSREAPFGGAVNSELRQLYATFGTQARNEETFVIEHARLLTHDAERAAARVWLETAVALRAFAQEKVWLPGMPAPNTRELVERYGLASLTFDSSVPARWRPYYRAVLADALADLYRVMPATDLRGLRIRFGAASKPDVLAMHEPSQRRLILPVGTSAGTLAHELAHDIDWQVALQKYRVRGDYATDRASGSDDPFAAQVRRLTWAATLASNAGRTSITAHARRPAEIFARGVDWYVSTALAREGRRNGNLSSVQDELITGYGTVRPPDITGRTGDALMTVLAELAPVHRDQRNAFRALYGTTRSPRSYDLVRQLTEAPVAPAPFVALSELESQRDSTLTALRGRDCGSPSQFVPHDLQRARSALIAQTAEARARGIAMRYTQRWLGSDGRAELVRLFYGAPIRGSEDAGITELTSAFNRELVRFAPSSAVQLSDGFSIQASNCSLLSAN